MHTHERARDARGASKVRVSVAWLSSPVGARVFCPLGFLLPKVYGYLQSESHRPKVINQQLFHSEKPKKKQNYFFRKTLLFAVNKHLVR